MPAKYDALRAQLADAGQRRRAAREALRAATADIERLAPRAIAAGMTKLEAAELGDLSRPGLDDVLKRTARSRVARRR
jgi:hypothetical protein